MTYGGGLRVVEATAPLQLLVQLAVRRVLEDEVDARRVVEVVVQPQHVWVTAKSGTARVRD